MFIDFPLPKQSWQEFVDSMPPGRVPGAQDIFDRWDAPRYVCPSYPRNGNADQKARHVVESMAPGHCKCGTPFRAEGLQKLGEGRAHRAWLAGLMDPQEEQYFWMAVASMRPEQVGQLAIVPAIRYLLQFERTLTGGAE